MAGFTIVEEDHARQLRVISVRGKLTIEELFEHAAKNFDVEKPALHLIWDLSAAEMDDVSTAHWRELAQHLAPLTERRTGGKSAMVVNRDLEFGLGRMAEVFAEMEHFKLDVRVFRTREEAEAWIFM